MTAPNPSRVQQKRFFRGPKDLLGLPVKRSMNEAKTVSSRSETRSLTAKVCFLAAGAVGLAMATIGVQLVSTPVRGDVPPAAPVEEVAVGGPGSLTLSGPGDVNVLKVAYEPGQSSGWHTHAGIHAVAVLSGTLTVYDGQCQAQHYGPGRPYIGGQELHLARNETAAPVEMVVTYLNPSTSTKADSAHPEGPACASRGGHTV
jgi:quercetin dioxygenase-like cupin family protein